MLVCADDIVEFEADTAAICMEDRLRSLGIISKVDEHTSSSTLNSATFKSIDLQTILPQKKVCLIAYLFCVVLWVDVVLFILLCTHLP